MKYTSFQEQRFRASVAKVMKQMQSILDHTRHPRLAEEETDHTYDDKFALVEFMTNTAVAAQMNALERLGLDGEKLQIVSQWVHQEQKSVTLRWEAQDSCAFFKERDVDVVTGERETETTTNTATTTSPTSASGGFLSGVASGGATGTTTGTTPGNNPTNTNTNTGTQKTETTKIKIVAKVKEYHWKVEATNRLLIFPGTDASAALELQSRTTSTFLVTSGGQAAAPYLPRYNHNTKPPTPIAPLTVHDPLDLNLTWFFQQIEPTEQVCQFHIDRTSVKAQRTCLTPRRNDDIDKAVSFFQQVYDWTNQVHFYLTTRLEGEIVGAHNPVHKMNASGSPETVEIGSKAYLTGLQKEPTFNGKTVIILEYSPDTQRFRVEPADKANSGLPSTLLIKPHNLQLEASPGPSLGGITTQSLFCPVVPLMENGTVLADVGELINEQCRALDGAIDQLSKQFPPRPLAKLVSVAEATIMLVLLHWKDLCTSYQDGVDYVENMLKQQLMAAIGKEISSKDFDQFIVFHNSKIFAPQYAPTPFTHAVRRPGHFPDGTFTIECTRQRNEPIHTLVRHVHSDAAPSIVMPINAATSIELTGNRYLHGWMLHRFKTKPRNEYEFIARARQFSSFLVVIGTMQGPNKFDPKDAIILQNKDEVLIPLLTNALPSAKEFKDSIASLSPEQQAFAKSYRNMQLESSVFGLCIIQLKPQLEQLLGLPDGALTKEIQLTQDLMSLFVEYQIPSDLLTFDGPAESDTHTKVTAVKEYVKSILNVIDTAKEKQLMEEERKADMRAELAGTGLPPHLHKSQLLARNERSHEHPSSDWKCLRGSQPDELTSFNTDGAGLVGSGPQPRRHMMMRAVEPPPQQQPSVWLASVAPQMALADTSEASGRSRVRRLKKASTVASRPSSGQTAAPSPSVPVRLETVQPATTKGDGGLDASLPNASSEGEDFTLIPKLLDAKLEKFDGDNALRSTIIKAGTTWTLNRQDNLLTPPKTSTLTGTSIESEKTKAFDLLDAISRSGALPIASSELHVIIAVSHCFENDVMGAIIQDNVNPIEKVEKSSLLIASTIYGQPPMTLLRDDNQVQRLTSAYPELGSADSGGDVEIYADQE